MPLPYVPPRNGLLALRYTSPLGGWWLEPAARWSADKTRIDPTQERRSDGYQVWSVYGGVDLGRFRPAFAAYQLTVGVDNVTDEAYVSPATRVLNAFPVSITNPLLEPGRSLTVNFTSRF